jgi:hypothetical protein
MSLAVNFFTIAFYADDEHAKQQLNTIDNKPSAEENSLFSEQNSDSNELTSNSLDANQIQIYKKKITVLIKQNKTFQAQIDFANQKQTEIITALNSIADTIDSRFLTPETPSINFQPSSYNMDFNAIPQDVVNKCIKVTSVASASVRHQQKQSRAQLLKDEVVDSVWGNEIESQIHSMISEQQLHNSELVSLNCRTTICKITVQHNSAAAQKLFEVPFFSRYQQNVSQYDETIDSTTNQPIGIFYLTRKKEY